MRATALVFAGLALATVVAHAPVMRAGFVMDDVPIVKDNPVVAKGDLGAVVRAGYWGVGAGGESGLYRPVTILSFVLERGSGGTVDAAGAHAVNLALHLLTALLLVALLLRLGAGLFAAGAGGLLFGLHPVHVSVVSGLVGRAELLATLFTFAALCLHTWSAPWPGSKEPAPVWRPRLAAWGTGLAFFLAMGSKEAAATAPLLLPWIDLLYRPPRASERRPWIVDRLGAYAPTALATVVYLVLRTFATEALPGVPRVFAWQNPLVSYAGASRLYTALGLVARYLHLLFLPTHLSADYSGAAVIGKEASLVALRPLAGLAALLVLAAIAIFPFASPRARRIGPAALVASVAAALFLVSYLVVSNLFTPIGVAMAERLIYLPSAGLCALAAAVVFWIVRHHPSSTRWLAVAFSAIGLTFGVLTWRAASDWRDEDSLFRAMVRSIPASPLGHHMIGQRLAREGRLDEAMAEFDEVLRTTPDSSADLYEKAVLFARKGDLRSAEPLYERSVHLDPWFGPAQADYGIVLHRLGKTVAAERRLRYAVRAFPGMEKPVSELADLLFESGRYSESVPLYREAVRLGRSDIASRGEEAQRRATGTFSKGPIQGHLEDNRAR
jgi:tetratricopeptide (TPR) repeat protein